MPPPRRPPARRPPQAAAEGPLVAALRQLFAVAEAYPDLKANQNFLALQSELANTEDRLQTSRRFYNANVRDYNERVKQFPSVIVANMFNFEEEEFFEVEEALREAGAPQVNFAGGSPGVSFGGPAVPGGTPVPPASPPARGRDAAGTAPGNAVHVARLSSAAARARAVPARGPGRSPRASSRGGRPS